MTDFSTRDRIRKLNEKGSLKIKEITRLGITVSILLPNEIKCSIIDHKSLDCIIDIEQINFYNDSKYRQSILEREIEKCFFIDL